MSLYRLHNSLQYKLMMMTSHHHLIQMDCLIITAKTWTKAKTCIKIKAIVICYYRHLLSMTKVRLIWASYRHLTYQLHCPMFLFRSTKSKLTRIWSLLSLNKGRNHQILEIEICMLQIQVLRRVKTLLQLLHILIVMLLLLHIQRSLQLDNQSSSSNNQYQKRTLYFNQKCRKNNLRNQHLIWLWSKVI